MGVTDRMDRTDPRRLPDPGEGVVEDDVLGLRPGDFPGGIDRGKQDRVRRPVGDAREADVLPGLQAGREVIGRCHRHHTGLKDRRLPADRRVVGEGVEGAFAGRIAEHRGHLFGDRQVLRRVPRLGKVVLLGQLDLSEERQEEDAPRVPRLAVGADHGRRRESVVGVVEIVEAESELLEVVARCHPAGRSTGLGNRIERAGAVACRLGLGDKEIGETADRFRGGGVGGPLTDQPRERSAEDGGAFLDGRERTGAKRRHGDIPFEDLFDVDSDQRVERASLFRGDDKHGLPLGGDREHRPFG